jgi:hypothetical protein
MAVVLQPRYPIPDRSKQTPLLAKDEDGVIDIGWCDGVLADGRPFRAEMWAQDGLSMLTFFFSTLGLADLDQAQIKALIVTEGLVRFKPGAPEHCESRTVSDDADNAMWSVNVNIGDDDATHLSEAVPVFPYSRSAEPNTMFNPVAIKAAHAAG